MAFVAGNIDLPPHLPAVVVFPDVVVVPSDPRLVLILVAVHLAAIVLLLTPPVQHAP